MDALSPAANLAGNASSLLFHTVFAGMALSGTPYSSGSLKNWMVDFSDSSDSTTGYDISADIKTILGSNTLIAIQSVPQSNLAADGSDFATYFSPTLTANELTLQCNARHASGAGTGNPQSTLLFSRSAAQALADDINEMCIMMYCKLPSGLDLQAGNTTTGKFYEIFEWKSGAYTNLSAVGDLRIKLELIGTNGFNEWVLTLDNNANGQGIIPGVGTSTVNYFRNFSGVAATLNTWTRCWIYWNRERGRMTAAIQPDGGEFALIGDAYSDDLTDLPGAKLYGAAELPITRLFMGNNYTSADLPNNLKIKEIQIWDKPPIKLV